MWTVDYIAEHEVPAALRLAEDTFAHLMPPEEVRAELRTVDWPISVRAAWQGQIQGLLLLSRLDLVEHCRVHAPHLDVSAYEGREGIQGEALVVNPAARPLVPHMLRLMTRLDADYFWGTAATELDNMRFWRRHATVLGRSAAADVWIFARALGVPRRAPDPEASAGPRR